MRCSTTSRWHVPSRQPRGIDGMRKLSASSVLELDVSILKERAVGIRMCSCDFCGCVETTKGSLCNVLKIGKSALISSHFWKVSLLD